MEEILRKIEENTAPKDSFQLTISNNTTDFITRFNHHSSWKKENTMKWHCSTWKLGIRFQTSTRPTSFKYSPDNGENWFTIQIPEGSYKICDIDAAIKQQTATMMTKVTNTSFLFRPRAVLWKRWSHVKWLSGGLQPTQLNEAHLGF